MRSTGLVGRWPLDSDTVVGTTARDVGRNKNNGTITAGTGGLTTGIHGEAEGAYNFDGSATKVVCGDVLNSGLGDFTISACVKISSGTWGTIATKGQNNIGHTYGLFYESSRKFLCYISNNVGTVLTTANDGTTIGSGSWHHVVATFDRDGNLTRYVDATVSGALLDISSYSAEDMSNVKEFCIGAWNTAISYGGYLTGDICKVRVYSYALSAGQIANLYQSYGL